MSIDHRNHAPAQRQFAFPDDDLAFGSDLPPLRPGRVRTACGMCGKVFDHIQSVPRQYCCNSCANRAIQVRLVAEGRKKAKPKTGRYRPCEQCGKPVYVKKWQEAKGFGRFCDRACKDQWTARNARVEPCEWCGTMMQLRPSSKRRFCSWECQTEGRRKRALDWTHNGRRACQTDEGYIYVWEPDHPRSSTYNGWYPQHRLVVERKIGRVLDTDEHVHHVDEDPSNNHPDNLMIVSAAEHTVITTRSTNAKLKAKLARLAEYERRFGPIDADSDS